MATVATPQTQARVGFNLRRWARSVWDSYLFRRILKALFTVWFVTTLLFFLVRLMPSNPIEIYITELMSTYSLSYTDARSQAAALFALDLDAPLWQQYITYMGQLLHGNLGTSLRSPGTPVTAIIAQFLPWTVFSIGTALIISVIIGVGLGIVMAYGREGWLDNILSAFASIMSSIPNYIIGILIIVFVAVQWKWLDIARVRGSTSPGIVPGFTPEFIFDIYYHAFLPILTYVLATVGFWMLTMRNNTLATLGEDYVTVARARGLSDNRIATAYVGRNAALPLVTAFAIALASVVGGAAVIEELFRYQGIGSVLVQSVIQRDYPVMQGCFLVFTFAVILANLVTDLCYGWLDPRIRLSGGE
ncbi:MAG: ABC transporter permease [Anaerolineae bacterium]